MNYTGIKKGGQLLGTLLILTLFSTSLSLRAQEKDQSREPLTVQETNPAQNLTLQPFGTGPEVTSAVEISLATNPEISLSESDRFGSALANIGDLDGDGIDEIVVGAPGDDTEGNNAGAFYVLFLDAAGQLRTFQKTTYSGNNVGHGGALAALGDLDGDGRQELAVGQETGFSYINIIFLNEDGSVNRTSPIVYNSTNFGPINNGDRFGSSLTPLGDVDGDGVPDLAAGAQYQDNARTNDGAVHVVFLNSDGSLKAAQEISSVAGNFDASAINSSSPRFGYSLAALPDLDGDGVSELIVAEASSSINIHLLYLENNGTVKTQKTVNTGTSGGGKSISTINDSDNNGVPEIALNTGSFNTEKLYFDSAGELTRKIAIAGGAGYFPQAPRGAGLGSDTAVTNDYNNDGQPEVMYGGRFADIGARDAGATFTLFEGEREVYDLGFSMYLDTNLNGTRDEGEAIFDIDDADLVADNGNGVYEYADTPAFENRDRLVGRLGANDSVVPNLPVGDYWIVLLDEDTDIDEEDTLTTYASTTHPTNPILVSLSEDTQVDVGFALASTIGNNVVRDANDNQVYDQTFELAGTALDLNDTDDSDLDYTLPFTFPFYGVEYSEVTLNTNGQMCFQEFNSRLDTCDRYNGRLDPTEDDFGPFIAPLWIDQALESGPEDNIYVTEKPDSVVFRWQTHGYDAILTPLNYAVELFRDGDIELHYGPVPTEPFLDSDSSDTEFAPVVAINDGTGGGVEGVNYQALTYHTYLDEQELLFDSLPAIRLEYTASGAYVESVVDDPGAADIEVNLYRDDGDTLFDPSADTFLRATRTDVFGKYLLDVFETGDYWVALNPDNEFYNARTPQASARLVTVESLGEHLFDADFLLTRDNDSVSNATENAAPNNGDANNDGILDSLQTNVASLPTLSGEYLSVTAEEECNLTNVTNFAETDAATSDEAYEYPHGLTSFRAECAATEIELFHYSDNARELRKLAGDYLDLTPKTQETLEIDGLPVIRYVYDLTDGGPFDLSPAGDGVIEDPIGLGVAIPVAETEEEEGEAGEAEEEPDSAGPEKLIRTGGF